MESVLSSSELFSHPGRLLEEHLINTAKLACLFLDEKFIENKDTLKELVKVIALSHDIGKSTSFFQKYLNAQEEEKKRLKNKKETKHGLISAVCAYYISKEITDDELLPFFSYVVVRRHHSNLIALADESTLYGEDEILVLTKQIDSINEDKFSILIGKLVNEGLPLASINKKLMYDWVNNFKKELRLIKKRIRELNDTFHNYLILNFLYSLLLDADKNDVVIKEINTFQRIKLDEYLVDNYKKQITFSKTSLNDLREKAYYEAISNLDICNSERIFSINLPTGLGKTLTSLSFALKLREKLGLNHRIIYALPFLSIVDQNSNIIEEIIKSNGLNVTNDLILKHHHLSEIYYKKEDLELESDEANILIEGWNSEIIVTTFVQLFHSLISNRNRSIRKFHRIINSIIILDEVQSIPIKYWLLLRNLLSEICKKFNTYIIFVTATEPLIFGRGEIKTLVNKDLYFKSLDRIIMEPLIEKNIKIEELLSLFNLEDEKTYLFIFNTINSAKKFYELLKNKDFSATYLSTHVIPKDRMKRIKEIKEKKYKIVVSTQLIEAGVDIDFDVVIRDLAPLDSINQSAGRCNRNGLGKGQVYIVSLVDEREKRYCSYVYDSVLIDITQNILKSKKKINESDFLSLIQEYYKKTEERKSQDISRELIESIIKLKYDSLDESMTISNFKLIDEDYPKRDVFIETDEESKQIWNKYSSLKGIKDPFERRKIFNSFKSDFYQYVVSIPFNTQNIPTFFGELGYVANSVLEDYYDKETGFKINDIRSVIIW